MTDDEILDNIESIIKETNEVFSSILYKTNPSDDRAKNNNAHWTERHRLHVLLDSVQMPRDDVGERVLPNPHVLVELISIVNLIKRWNYNPNWGKIQEAFVNSTNFTHTISKLRLAELYIQKGHRTKLVPTSKQKSPDLHIQAFGGTQDWLRVECYQPRSLIGEQIVLSKKKLTSIINKTMRKGKDQIGGKFPGIVVICGFYMSKNNITALKETITNRFERTKRTYLAGIMIMNQFVD